MLKAGIEIMMRGENLPPQVCEQAINSMLEVDANPLQIAAFLVLLRSKRETAQELCAIINTLRSKMISVKTITKVLDIVGTGGDGLQTINISTGSAILAASCGVKIAKHGNRSVSSLTGSADVLEALGININLSAEQIAAGIARLGIGFCYAPNFHPITQTLRNLRKQLNVPTTFNYLGPLLNPANAEHLILGVADAALLPTIAEVLMLLGTKKSIIVHGRGLDEISCVGPVKVIEIQAHDKIEYILDPAKLGLPYCSISDLRGGDPQTNANLLLDTFKGKPGPIADTLILNAAVALYIYGLYVTIDEALAFAREQLHNGTALTLLNNWIEFSNAQ